MLRHFDMNQTNQPEQCVADAAILLDLKDTQLLPALLDSDVRLITTPLVMNNLDRAHRRELQMYNEHVIVVVADEAEMNALLAEVGPANKMTGSDRLMCRMAKRMKLPLLTGCSWLQGDAERQGLRVRTLVWVLDRLVTNRIMSPANAARRLSELQRSNLWLNKKLCREYIMYWHKLSQPNIILTDLKKTLYS